MSLVRLALRLSIIVGVSHAQMVMATSLAGRPQPPTAPGQTRDVVPAPVLSAALNAARGKQLDALSLLAFAWRENALSVTGGCPNSSAAGLMQFTRDAWLDAVRAYGGQMGLAYESSVIKRGSNDSPMVTAGAQTEQRILDMRNEPALSLKMSSLILVSHADALRGQLGHEPGAADFYLVHNLGLAGALRFLDALQKTPDVKALNVIGKDVARANASLYGHVDAPLSVAESYAGIQAFIAERRAIYATQVFRAQAERIVAEEKARHTHVRVAYAHKRHSVYRFAMK